MKDNVTRTAIKNESGQVFLVTESIRDLSKNGRTITEESIITTEVNDYHLDEYEEDRQEQYEGFKNQEKDTKNRIKSLTKDIKKYSGERGYKAYKKNFEQFEIYENFIEQNVNVEAFMGDKQLKEFKKYEKKRDTYKNFYVTMQMEMQLEVLENNLKAFEDIWEEDKMFVKQIKEARKLLK